MQARHLVPDRLKQPSNLAVSAFRQLDHQMRFAAGGFANDDPLRRQPFARRVEAGDVDAGFEPRGELGLDTSAHGHEIPADDGVRGIRERGGERGVGGQDEEPGRGAVEPAGRDQSVAGLAEHVEHRPSSFRIAARRHRAARLVERDHTALDAHDRGVVHADARARGDADRAVGRDTPVHAHTAVADQRLRVFARGDAQLRQQPSEWNT